ncbi:hypothetical protein F4778DRAFT_748166 [Xylariomycetidae sp. FL2044]|nr:hypothetical protein F4778DRAFT_748166 [Xylariomycetidae sp. FL2044]
MASFLGLPQNVSYLTIPAVFVVTMYPRFLNLSSPGRKFFDGRNPRTFPDRLEKSDLDKRTQQRLLRCEACTANGFEGLPLFAAAVTAGNAAGLSAAFMNTVAVGYLVSRVAFTYIYVWAQEDAASGVEKYRTLVWLVGVGLLMSAFVKAGLNL